MKIIKKINDTKTGMYIGFITEYPNNDHISQTTVYGLKYNDDYEIIESGHMTVSMRDGEQYTFDCMADTVYCGQFGITVSKDGTRIYVISDEVGLWCYSYDGAIQWKTRYTSIGHVIENDDQSITCISSTKLLQLDVNGKKIKEKKIVHYHAVKASENIIYAATSEYVRVLIDSKTLEVMWQISLKNMDLVKSRYALIYDRYLIVNGEKEHGRIVYIPIKLPPCVYEKSRYDESLVNYYCYESYFKETEFNNLIWLESKCCDLDSI